MKNQNLVRRIGLLLSVFVVAGLVASTAINGDDSTSSSVLRAVNERDLSLIESVQPQRRSEVSAVILALNDLSDEWHIVSTQDGLDLEIIELEGHDESQGILIFVVRTSDYFDLIFSPLRDLTWYSKNFPQFAIVVQSASDCKVLAEIGETSEAVPLASLSKLVALVAVDDLVESGTAKLTQELRIMDHHRSLPSGSWHQLPSGSRVTIREAITQSYRFSDNTATDVLVDFVGREQVSEIAREYLAAPEDEPFLLTSDVFKINWSSSGLAEDYANGSAQTRQHVLEELSSLPLPPARLVSDELPAIPTVGWRGKITGMCEIWSKLVGDTELAEIYSTGTHLEFFSLGMTPVAGKGGFAPDISAFTGVGRMACGEEVVMSVVVAGAPVDNWSAMAAMYRYYWTIEREIEDELCA